ncbi:helix-turn-helix domain-containing protein [Georhizobium profundi]|uniref:Helix-turn-helix domain-containing protein n=1 Tax=Georhizobium profundi TaxID=2341112 RepID=A0A3Q8XQ27_9HYPH|nr:helix-turn-helix domain-containing protein [Georhizobium profundi]AZN72751.1 helix-turn-helix domain-containing protein [Georhizobium profundi]
MGNFEPAFDLLGDPIPEGFGKKGRPPHIPTEKNRSKIILLLAQGWTDPRIAGALGISLPTLRKHYFRELKVRDIARDRVEAIGLLTLWEQAKAGNTAAMKEFFRRHDASIEPIYDERVNRETERRGKKEQDRLEAESPPNDWESVIPPQHRAH